MAPDTKVPDGRTDGRPDGQRQNNIPSPLAGDNNTAYVQRNIIGTNLLTKFHKDRNINVASRVLTRKIPRPPPPGSHVFQPTGIIFELVQDIIGMDLLTKFHEDRTVNVASRVHFFQTNIIIFKLIQDIIKTNLLTKFHEDWTINVASIVLTRKNAPPLVAVRNLLTKFHDDQKIYVTSRMLTRKIVPPPWWPYIIGMNLLPKKNAPPLGSHVFQAKVNIFEHIQDISGTNLLSKFHKDRKINVASRVLTRKNAPPPGGHVFQPTGIIFFMLITLLYEIII
ncbi:hypothetical protein DPMN_090408 [Dreissena polymorpha]|uniref:Uncharacterized protein n=1 Tax=Dreissena polymorpha TaxID=45954 RepID=A0A9D4KXN0_DREPO|nr:hypothetical protein DPMN_090408 [Dreissena polymorpha]